MRRLGFVLCLAIACAGSQKKSEAAAPPAATAATPAGVNGRRLMVVGINDTHGALLSIPPPKWVSSITKSDIGGADWFAGWVNAIRADYKAKGGEVVVLDAGDEFQGTLISNEFRGRSVTEVYNAIGLTASAIGNHEFDFGLPVLLERIAQAKYAVLAANIFNKGAKTRPGWAKPSVLIDQGGIKIGIIGLATRETPLTTNPINIEGLDFADGGPVAAQEADALHAKGATVVLITAHAGPYPPDNEIQHIAEAVKGRVDAIVSGHHHTAYASIDSGIPVVQSGAKLQSFSTIELTLDDTNHVRQFAVDADATPKQGGPQAILHMYNGQPATFRGQKVEPDGKVSAILRDYPRRAVLGLVLMASQAFFYNAIFFSYALVLTRFYQVPSGDIGWYMLPFALGNFLGPLLLGHLFDTLGRKPMIAFTYAISGVLLVIVGYLFRQDMVDAATLTACWSGIFFFASAAASAAYLTVSESFPLEARALAIAFFYAIGTAIGGVASPWLFGMLVGTGERGEVFLGYLFGAGLMIAAAVVELLIGVKAERQPLESVARPISAVEG